MLNAVSAISLYATLQGPLPHKASAVASPETISKSKPEGEKVSISSEGQAKLAATNEFDIANRVTEVRAKSSASRSSEDIEFVWKNDPMLIEIRKKLDADGILNTDEIAIVNGLVRDSRWVDTTKYLSDAEKKLYNKLADEGNREGCNAMGYVGFARHTQTSAAYLPNGAFFYPRNTPITPETLRSLFCNSTDSERDIASMKALANYLSQQKNLS